MITTYQKLILDVQNEISEDISIMKRVICFILCAIMIMSSTYTVLATETTDISYNTLSVEFSDNLGMTEELNVMMTDDHLYVDAEQLGDRLGYQVEVGNEYVAISNKNFSNTVPYGLTTFYYDSTKVRHMLFNKMVDYEAPFKIVKNSDCVWIPFEFSLLLLNSSDVVLDNQVHIEMPQKNIVDIYMDILKNNDRYLFDWKSDAGASEGSIFAMGTGAYFVQVFSGILDKDGASWSQLIDSFYLKMDSYDRKYAESFARMFCTYSDEELTLNAKAMKEKMKPFNGDNWVAKSIKKVDDIIDDNIGDLSEKTADLKKKIDVENGASVAKFNKSYQELDKMCNTADYFSDMTDPFLTASKEFKNVTSFLDVFYKISEVIGYASEFKNQDEFAVKSLDTLIKKSDSSCVMSKAMKDSMGDYKKTLETDIVAYSAYNYLMNNMTDLFTDTIDISTTILDMDSKLYLLAWDIAKGAIPLVKNSLSNTDCFLQSMYAGIIQSDTFSTYINKRNVVFGDAKNITSENLYELSQYCYAYLKSCYITRDAAVGSLTEKTKKNNPTYESTQKMVNQEIAEYLIKLKNADKTNKYGCYGFLPENNEQYLGEYDDSSIIDAVQNKSDLKVFVGTWVLDSVATNKNNDRSLSFMYGSGLTQYGADLEIDENGDFSFYIGIGLGGKGVCSIEDDHLNYNINMYEENQNVQDTMLIGKDKKYLIMKDINDNSYNLYWIRKGAQSVYNEVEEENVGKDEIELSGYIGENISQIDQNIKFTIENEVDAGKFKQNDNVCFACHKDDSIKIKNQNWTDNDEVSPLFSNPYTNLKSLNNVGYALIDIDGNGVPELLIGDNESVSDGVIIDLYTYIDDSIVYLDTSGERYGIKLSKNGRIYRYGSGGAGLTEVEECKIDMDNLKLTTVEGVLYDEDDAKDTPWFYGEGDEYSNSNGYDISKMKNITEEEGMNKWDEYSNNIKGYTISFFSNYTPKKSKEDIDAGIYEEFIKNGDYNNYLTSDWEYGMPSQYAVLDIDGNGVDELIIYGNENEWGNIIVFTYKGDTQEIVPIQANLYDTGDTSRKTNVIWFCKNMEYSPQYHALAFTDSHYGVGNEDYLYYTINNDVFDIAFDVSAFTNYNTGDIQYSKGGINVERNDISESDYEAYINELKPIEWKKLP